MFELIRLTDKTCYIESPAKIGVILLEGNGVAIIDSGNDKDAGKKIKKVLDAQGWSLKTIYNTHSHADHIGGNQYLQKQTGCAIFAPGIERDFTCHPILESCFLYGGDSSPELRHKFLMAQPSDAKLLTEDVLPDGVKAITLPGHSFDMVGFRTADDVVFLADCLSSKQTLDKYQISFLVDVAGYLDTLEQVKQMEAAMFVPAHAAPTEDIAPLAQYNIDKVLEIGEKLCAICGQPVSFDDILRQVFTQYDLQMTFEQHALVGSTVRSYLTWLKNTGRLTAFIDDNRLLWQRV